MSIFNEKSLGFLSGEKKDKITNIYQFCQIDFYIRTISAQAVAFSDKCIAVRFYKSLILKVIH